MDQKEILNFCLKKGILLDKEVLNLFREAADYDSIKIMVEGIKKNTQKKFITKNVFYENLKQESPVFSTLPQEKQKKLEKLKIRLGLEFEISKEISEEKQNSDLTEKNLVVEGNNIKARSLISSVNKKLEVGDFVKYFRNRFLKLRSILQGRPTLKDLTSINKISGSRQKISLIGIVSSKRTTKNKNTLLEIEDLTGKIRVLINQNRPELYKKAGDIALDSIIGIKGRGNREILFAEDIVFPDSAIPERKRSPVEEYALFISDIHYGSKLFLKENFNKFIKYLNGELSNSQEVEKIKYLFIIGDLVSGVGIYPEQEKDLEIKDIEKQFIEFAELLKKIRKDITIIVSPGNHDGIRLMEPQPIFDKKYSWPLYELENVIITTNPAYINIGQKETFSGFEVLTYHGFSYPYYADNISSLIEKDAMNSPEDIMRYLLKNRHLAPTHSSVQYYPLEEDPFVIENVPDFFVSGHTHKCAVSYYNNILIISCSSWESLTEYQEKLGNKPDFCKVPMVNLKTRAVKILDFE